MKRIIAYSTAIILLLVSGCSKPLGTTVPEQFDRYIFFSQGVDTKAGLIESTSDLAGKEFAVLGYKYDINSTWDAFKATNEGPNVFVTGDNKYETVECDASGDGSYEPLQGWSNSKKYTFFAYYPKDLAVKNYDPNTFAISNYTGGSPYLFYVMDYSQTDVKSKMVDIMTGGCHHLNSNGNKEHTSPCQKDLFWKSSSTGENNVANGEVKFRFEHRLSSLGVKAKLSQTGGTVKITGIKFKLEGIKNRSIIIPLEGGASRPTGPLNPISADVTLDIPDGKSVTATDYSEVSDKLIFIPQDSQLSIRIVVDYERSAPGYVSYSTSITIPAEDQDPLSISSLAEGTKYMIPLNFTETSVTVSGAVTGQNWNNSYEVPGTFN